MPFVKGIENQVRIQYYVQLIVVAFALRQALAAKLKKPTGAISADIRFLLFLDNKRMRLITSLLQSLINTQYSF